MDIIHALNIVKSTIFSSLGYIKKRIALTALIGELSIKLIES